MAVEAPLVALRHRRGCRSFALCVEERPAAYGWVSTDPEWIGEARLTLRPGAREAYVWNCLTLERHRRRGMFGSLLRQLSTRLQAEGLTRLWIADAGGGGTPALRRAGFEPALDLLVVGAGPLRAVFASAPPKADRWLVRTAREALDLPSFGRTPPARAH
jgi:hypothetical protein